MDIHNAFSHGYLDKEVFMKLPHGFRSDNLRWFTVCTKLYMGSSRLLGVSLLNLSLL